MLRDFVETSSLGEDGLRSWEQFLSAVTGSSPDGRETAVCPPTLLEELIDVKCEDAIHVVVVGILDMHLG